MDEHRERASAPRRREQRVELIPLDHRPPQGIALRPVRRHVPFQDGLPCRVRVLQTPVLITKHPYVRPRRPQELERAEHGEDDQRRDGGAAEALALTPAGRARVVELGRGVGHPWAMDNFRDSEWKSIARAQGYARNRPISSLRGSVVCSRLWRSLRTTVSLPSSLSPRVTVQRAPARSTSLSWALTLRPE